MKDFRLFQIFYNFIIYYYIIKFIIRKLSYLMKISEQTKKQSIRKPVNKQQNKPGIWDSIIKTIVRPPRSKYTVNQLGTLLVSRTGDVLKRRDIQIVHESKKIEISIFDPEIKKNKIILYLHGNSSSRLQSKSLIQYLPEGFSLAGFDFIGCGMNHEEDIITLGHQQSKQVESVANYLRCEHYQVILWGRSMGAVSALKYGKANVIVADSPFRDIRKLFKEMSNHQQRVPNCIVSCFFPCVFWKIKQDVQQKAKYDLGSLNIEKAVQQISPATTIIFLTGNRDTLISQYNSQKLYNIFKGKHKYLEVVQGNHNDRRPSDTLTKIMKIIQKQQKVHNIIAAQKQEEATENMNLYISQKQAIQQNDINIRITDSTLQQKPVQVKMNNQ